MQLYIANATRMIQVFSFRLKGRPSATSQPIPIGGQTIASGVNSQDEIDQVLKQHEQYGLVSVDDIERSKTEFHGLCYSVDRPINVSKMEAAMRRNMEVLTRRGEEMRKQAAMSVNNSIESSIEQSGTEANLKKLEFSVVEQEPRGGKPEPLMSEGIRVSRSDAPGEEGRAAQRGGRKGRR